MTAFKANDEKLPHHKHLKTGISLYQNIHDKVVMIGSRSGSTQAAKKNERCPEIQKSSFCKEKIRSDREFIFGRKLLFPILANTIA